MTGIIILAAGASGRLGQPKQNLNYNGKTLLQRSIDQALATGCAPVIVVLGANKEIIEPTIAGMQVDIAYNDKWREGMSSSIRAGITHLQKTNAKISSVILMLCDQPFVTDGLLSQLIAVSTAKSITVCAYDSAVGPPVLFDSYYFPDLLLLKGNEGAKQLMLKYEAHLTTVPFVLGCIDIDTKEDFERLKDFS
ncbi:MAG: nucleotidyltransferase family protein [Mucilaginibacter sp.]